MGSISHHWHDDAKTIMTVTYTPGWTWDNFHANAEATFAEIRTQDHPVVIIQERPYGSRDKGSAIPHLRRVAGILPPNVIMSAVIFPSKTGVAHLARRLLTIFITVYESEGSVTRIVGSFEEALKLAHEKLGSQVSA